MRRLEAGEKCQSSKVRPFNPWVIVTMIITLEETETAIVKKS